MRHVLLVDDHAVIRALLRQILEEYSDIVIVAEAEDGEEAVKQALRLHPSVALIDCHLPRLSGVEVTQLIKRMSPCTTIIGLTAGEPNDGEMEMLRAGAVAVLNKADVFQQLYPLIVKTCPHATLQAAVPQPHLSSVPIQTPIR